MQFDVALAEDDARAVHAVPGAVLTAAPGAKAGRASSKRALGSTGTGGRGPRGGAAAKREKLRLREEAEKRAKLDLTPT